MTLTEAVEALDRGDAGAALGGMLEAWTSTRGPRLSALIRAVQVPERPALAEGTSRKVDSAWHALAAKGDPLDVPRLVAGLLGGTANQGIDRLAALADDPRLTSGLIALLEAPPKTSNGSMPFWRAVFARLVELGEPGAADALVRLADGYTSRVPTSVGEWMGNQCAKVAAKLAKSSAADPDDPALGALEKRLAGDLGTLVREDAAHRNDAVREEDLLAAVYASPDDPGPRHAYCDWLLEQGDARGEWMRRQLDGDETPPDDPKLAIRVLGGIAGAVMSARYRDGFADRVWLWGSKTAIPKSVGRPEWATVAEMQVHAWPSPSYAPDRAFHKKMLALVGSPAMVSLKRLYGPSVEDFVSLLDTPLKLEAVGFRHFLDASLPGVRAVAEAWRPSYVFAAYHGDPDAVLGALEPAPLRGLGVPGGDIRQWLERLDGTGLEVLDYTRHPLQGILDLRRGPDGHLSDLVFHPAFGFHQAQPLVDLIAELPHVTGFAFGAGEGAAFVRPHVTPFLEIPEKNALAEALGRFGVTAKL